MALHKKFYWLQAKGEAEIQTFENKIARETEAILADLAPSLYQYLEDTVENGMTAEDFKQGGRIVKEVKTYGPGWLVDESHKLSGLVIYYVNGFRNVEVYKILEVSRTLPAVRQKSIFELLGEDSDSDSDWVIGYYRVNSWVISRLPRQNGSLFGDTEQGSLGGALVVAGEWEAEAINRERNRMSRPGQILRSIRTLAALTQDQVAAEIGVSGDQVSRFELGKISPPLKYLLILADMTGVPFLGIVAMLAKSLGNEYAPDPEQHADPYQAYKELLAWAGENMPQDQ